MRQEIFTIHLAAALALLSTPALSQTPPTQEHINDIGFSYRLPSDWEFVEQQPAPVVKPDPAHKEAIPDEKKGAGCVQVALTARHGDPASVIVAVMLPFDCYGQIMTATELPGFGEGAAEGLKEAYDITATAITTYLLDGHSFWIERAAGAPKGQENPHAATLEIACTMLSKGAVCWMVVAADDTALQTFETGLVTLDGGAAHPLVPSEDAATLIELTPRGAK